MKNETEYSEYTDQKIENYINYNSDIVCTRAKPIWTLKHIYTILLINIYENNKT